MFESEFTLVNGRNEGRAFEALVNKRLAKKLKPRILLEGKPIRHFYPSGKLPAIAVRWFCRRTFSQHAYGRYPNPIKPPLIARPDQVWCSDISYARLRHEFVYLAFLLGFR